MSNKAFETILNGALFDITIFVSRRILEIILEKNEEIEEMFSRLEDCEEKLSQCEKS